MSCRRIAVVTGTRADYGLLYWLLHDLHASDDFELQLIVTGMHLMPEFGRTITVIKEDGFPIAAEVDLRLHSDEAVAVGRAVGVGMMAFSEVFERLKPDVVVVLGDRFEMLAVAVAAFIQRVPVAHIHGGEVTEGALDDGFRHAITKLSSLHFTAAEAYRRRVIQMGEPPTRVFNVGAPGLEYLSRTKLLDRPALEREIDFEIGSCCFLVTYHPATNDHDEEAAASCEALLTALDAFPEAQVILTKPNADPGGRVVMPLLEAYAARHPGRCKLFASLGQRRYLSLLRHARVVVGNSSSGIIEAPSFATATVNMGTRQKGRLRAASVIDCAVHAEQIEGAIREALKPSFQKMLAKTENPYGAGDSANRILTVLRGVNLTELQDKPFHDLSELTGGQP